jgi:PAS domain S-box-containing protein
MATDAASVGRLAFRAQALAPAPTFLSTSAAADHQRRLAYAVLLVSALAFCTLAPFAKSPLTPVPAFLPAYQSALLINDLITAVLLFGQFSILRSRALLVLAGAYLFSAAMATAHLLTFPGLFATGGLFGAGPQTTAWLYFLWHGGFPLMVIAYALLKDGDRGMAGASRGNTGGMILASVLAVAGLAAGLLFLTTSGHDVLPVIMSGDQDASRKIQIAAACWALSFVALAVLWRRRPHSLIDLWLMVTLCAWIFDIALAAVLNGARYDVGWYGGRVYGLLAASFVLLVLLLENSVLHAQIAAARESEQRRARAAFERHEERLRILHQIDHAIIRQETVTEIAGVVVQPLRALLDVPRAIVNAFDMDKGEVEWLAAAGRQRTHVGPGVRYPLRMMGDLAALKRGETQIVDTRALPPGPEVTALLASGVKAYMVVPMIAGGQLMGAISFGGEEAEFPVEHVSIAREVAAQLAIAITQTRLLKSVKRHASELEARVRERTRELNDLYENAPCGYHSVDAEGRITRVNGTWLKWLGRERQDVLGRRHSELMTPASAQRFRDEAFPRFLSEGRLDDVEFEYQRKDGSVMVGLLNATAIRGEDGRLVSSRSVVYDATERKHAADSIRALNADLERKAEELTTLNRELEAFSYSVSHDLRSPLRAIAGFAQILAEDYGPALDDEGRRLLRVVTDNCVSMGQLIEDLLKFSRAGRAPLAVAPLQVEALVRGVIADLTLTHPKARVELGSLPAANGDTTLLRQVWVNLIGNALKYSANAAEPRVQVGGRVEGAECVYWVRDNGAGFDMRYAEKLFKVFQRLHDASEFEGTGVGLAIVQRIVTRHGGRIWAEGKPGEGACFQFTLPAGGAA